MNNFKFSSNKVKEDEIDLVMDFLLFSLNFHINVLDNSYSILDVGSLNKVKNIMNELTYYTKEVVSIKEVFNLNNHKEYEIEYKLRESIERFVQNLFKLNKEIVSIKEVEGFLKDNAIDLSLYK